LNGSGVTAKRLAYGVSVGKTVMIGVIVEAGVGIGGGRGGAGVAVGAGEGAGVSVGGAGAAVGNWGAGGGVTVCVGEAAGVAVAGVGDAAMISNGPICKVLVQLPSSFCVRKWKYHVPGSRGGLVVLVADPGRSATVSGRSTGRWLHIVEYAFAPEMAVHARSIVLSLEGSPIL